MTAFVKSAKAGKMQLKFHTLRVAPRLGMADEKDGPKMEQQLMAIFPPKQWDIGMALSFHGREICRPKPLCEECIVNKHCAWYKANIGFE